MEQRKRIFIFPHLLRWVVARPIRSIAFNASSYLFAEDRSTQDELPRKFRGEIHFGLFQGTKVLNYGLGDRTTIIWLKQEMSRNPNLMTFSLWLFTILAVSIAMIFGLVGAIFSIINTVMTPVEAITGVQGLYLWNGLASLFCGGATLTWIAQFLKNLRRNVLTEEEQNDGWTSEGKARLGYSFYFVLVASLLHLVNIALVYSATRTPRRNKRAVLDKHPEGLIMLY
ncbi:hypothetical protein TYRP_007226 [Tyrophagus putrescentiae]|nr:hypothetical protein TYRP_007226 [Tyrophagus putrescentiae]